ncbi:hypothetical protein [Verrucomicrobium sp. BvORR106]|uniref:hypothetical protein n=1 Tax=Verrucomicrobium sp. BvORR106 TaxID=1403819 RepID=UPI002241009B|nr:hypothetical protein [Verrucomicrobium sp. BvORR106]
MMPRKTKVIGGKFSARHGTRLACLLAGLAGAAALGQIPALPSASGGSPPPPSATQARDVVTEEELKKLAQPENTLSSMLAKATTQAPVAARPSMESSLYRKSVILYDGAQHTVVPIGSVLQLPAGYRNRVVEKPVGTFTFWPAFLERNAAWLGAWEVPLSMAEGNAEVAKKVLASTVKDSRVLVAVYRGGPITILEPVPEPSSKAKSGTGTPNVNQEAKP